MILQLIISKKPVYTPLLLMNINRFMQKLNEKYKPLYIAIRYLQGKESNDNNK